MRRVRNQGWVLLETLVALVLLSVGVLAINRAMRESLATHAIARDYTVARFLLERKMSELEMQTLLDEGAQQSGSFGDEHPRFTFSWSVTRVDMPQPEIPAELQAFLIAPPELPEPYLGKITVTVSWTRAERPYSATAETLIDSRRLRVKEPPNAVPEPAV